MMQTLMSLPAAMPQQLDLTLELGPTLVVLAVLLLVAGVVTALSVLAGSTTDPAGAEKVRRMREIFSVPSMPLP